MTNKNRPDKATNIIGTTVFVLFSLLLMCLGMKNVPSKQKTKENTTQQILSTTHSNAVNSADTINALEQERIITKEINNDIAHADSATAANRIKTIVDKTAHIKKMGRQLNIGGMNMGTNYNFEIDQESLDQNIELAQAVQDYHDAIIFLARSRATMQK